MAATVSGFPRWIRRDPNAEARTHSLACLAAVICAGSGAPVGEECSPGRESGVGFGGSKALSNDTTTAEGVSRVAAFDETSQMVPRRYRQIMRGGEVVSHR